MRKNIEMYVNKELGFVELKFKDPLFPHLKSIWIMQISYDKRGKLTCICKEKK
jgi:hypothetical protein